MYMKYVYGGVSKTLYIDVHICVYMYPALLLLGGLEILESPMRKLVYWSSMLFIPEL